MGYEGASHDGSVHLPKALDLLGILATHGNVVADHVRCVSSHVRAFEWSEEVGLHEGVAFVHEVVHGEGLLIGEGIGIDDKVEVVLLAVGGGPEEVLATLVVAQLFGHEDGATEVILDQGLDKGAVCLLEEFDLTVHLRPGEEVHNGLLVLVHVFGKCLLAGRLYGHYHLRCGLDIALELELGLCIEFADVRDNDVAEYAESVAELLFVYLHDAEGALALWQSGHIGVESIKEGTSGRTFPSSIVHDDKHLVGCATGVRSHNGVSILARSGQQGECGKQAGEGDWSFHNRLGLFGLLLFC